jgi:hypothetical protein
MNEETDLRKQKNMKREEFQKIIKECMTELKNQKSPRQRLKESLRPLVEKVLNEIAISNIPSKPEPSKEEKEKVQKGYSKDKNIRIDKDNEKLLKELESIVHAVNKDWCVYWADNRELHVDAQNLMSIRITPRFENNFDIDAMPRLVDRVRAIALTWDQVKAFVKANLLDVKDQTIASAKQKQSIENQKEKKENDGKSAGPRHDIATLRTGNVKDTKREDKMYNEPQVKKDEDLPDQPMKDVGEPKNLNKNIKKTEKVAPPKHKNDKKLKVPLKKTSKFGKKQIN